MSSHPYTPEQAAQLGDAVNKYLVVMSLGETVIDAILLGASEAGITLTFPEPPPLRYYVGSYTESVCGSTVYGVYDRKDTRSTPLGRFRHKHHADAWAETLQEQFP